MKALHVINAVKLYYAISQRRADSKQAYFTHPLNEASWRASIDGFMESMASMSLNSPIISYALSLTIVW